MPEKTDISTVQVPANATKEQLLAALSQANAAIESATATRAELVSANHELAAEVNALKDANDKLAAEVSSLKDVKAQLENDLSTLGYAASNSIPVQAGRATHVRVSSAHKAGQHYRAGRLWTRDPVDVCKNEFTDAQLIAMHTDPMLVVVDL